MHGAYRGTTGFSLTDFSRLAAACRASVSARSRCAQETAPGRHMRFDRRRSGEGRKVAADRVEVGRKGAEGPSDRVGTTGSRRGLAAGWPCRLDNRARQRNARRRKQGT